MSGSEGFFDAIRKALWSRLAPDSTHVSSASTISRLHWFDLDLPDAVELRRRFFTDSERRMTLAGVGFRSGLDRGGSTEPRTLLLCRFATANRKAIDGGNKDFTRRNIRRASNGPAKIRGRLCAANRLSHLGNSMGFVHGEKLYEIHGFRAASRGTR